MSRNIELTELAQKYTHPTGPPHVPIASIVPLKSGLTPLSPRDPNFSELEWYQRQRFYGFTGDELLMAESLAHFITDDLSLNLDDGYIHPIYQKKNWQYPLPRHLAKFPIRKGRPGFWDVDNPDIPIWKLMGPALKLCSAIIINAHQWPWFDALLEGEWDVIPDDNLPPEFQHRGEYERWRSFKPRAPETAFQARRSVQERFARVADHVEFHFISIRGGTDSGVVSDYAAYARGIMFGIGHYPSRATAVISISYELFEPLLRTDLTAAERAVQTFIFALTLFHETCHAMTEIYRLEKAPTREEPYFDGDCLTEIGLSMTQAIFGNLAENIATDYKDHDFEGVPAGGVFAMNWPTAFWGKYRGFPVLVHKPPEYMFRSVYPIAAKFFMELQKPEYWSVYLTKYGSESSRFPKTIGCRQSIFMSATGFKKSPKRQFIFANENIILSKGGDIRENMTPAEIRAREIETDRENRGRRIKDMIYGKNIDFSDIREEHVPRPRNTPEPPPMSRVECPRYDEIRNYLIENRQELALDNSMNFGIPEHILYNHIIHNGGLSISLEEWRKYLTIATHTKDLFRYTISPVYMVYRRATGWPPLLQTTSRPSRWRSRWRSFTRSNLQSRMGMPEFSQCFENALRYVLNNQQGDCFEDGYLDYDEDELRCFLNQWYYKNGKHRIWGNPGFTQSEMQQWIRHNPWLLTNGPKGIVRMVDKPNENMSNPPNKAIVD